MEIGLAGQCLTRVLVDFDLYLEFESGDTVELTEFSIVVPTESANARTDIGYENIAQGLAGVLPLIGATCVEARCEGGELSVVFGGGVRIFAPYSDGEAWEFSGGDGRRVISGPGGEVSTWSAK